MRKIFTGEYIKALDQYTIEHDQVSSVELIDRAALAFVDKFTRLFPSVNSNIIVFAGGGNNGADALAIAYGLQKRGFDVASYLINTALSLTPECREKKELLESLPESKITEVTEAFEFPPINSRTIIIDGLFGCGINRKLEGGYLQLVRFINESGAPIVAIDIPSGMNPNKGGMESGEEAIKATYTFTFEFPKKAFFFAESLPFTGKIEVLDIDLSEEGKKLLPSDFMQTTDLDIDSLLRPREKFAHKGTFGHGLLIAGSQGKMGAAVLASRGALRSGIGKLTALVPSCGEVIMQTAIPEAMILTESSHDHLSQSIPLQSFDAIAVGPGLGQSERSFRLLESMLSRSNKPLILDADALNILAESRDLLSLLPEESILTPHPKELERLTGYCETSEQRLQEALIFASRYSVYVVLKGANTAICTPSGKVIFNPTGNPALATPGSGDVLTGIICSFLAQGYTPYTSAILATYLHGLAGDYYAARYDTYSMLASDIADILPETFKGFGKE